MKYTWLDDYCINKKGTEKDFQPDWNATRYKINEKIFAMVCTDKEGKPIINLKLEPQYGEYLREQYTDIIPGYHMNKIHWNSLYLDGNVPDTILKDMIDKSYNLIFSSLSKLKQEIILKL